MKENHKKILILSTFLLAIVLFCVGTIAYFRRTVNGIITGNAGNLVLIVNEADAVKNETFTVVLQRSEEEPFILPDDKGTFDINIISTGSTDDVSVTIDITRTNLPDNLRFYLDENYQNELTNKTYIIKHAAVMEKTVPVYWFWDGSISDENDIDFINQVITADVSVTAAIGVIDAEDYLITGLDGQFQYRLVGDNKIQLTRYLGSETEVVIPAEYDGYKVYSVGNPDANPLVKAERYNIFGATNSISNNTVTSITISEGIEVIETAAFSYCTAWVGELTLPSTLKEIGAFAFNHTESLTGDITIPEGVVKMGDAVFQSSKKYDGFLTLPSTLEEIGTSTFNQLEGLKNETIVIPKSLKIIGRASGDSTHTFYNAATKTLKEFVVHPENPYYKAIDGVLFSIDGTRLVSYPPNKEGNTYEIPEGVTVLDELGFSRAGSSYSNVPDTGLKKLVLPNSYILTTTVPDCYLNTGNNLAVALYLYTGVNEIAVKDDNPNYKTDSGILYSKDGTTLWYVPIHKTGAINILDGVTTIKGGAFYGTNRTQTITIPASVTSIDARAITELQNLTSSKVTFADGSKYYFSSSKVISTRA